MNVLFYSPWGDKPPASESEPLGENFHLVTGGFDDDIEGWGYIAASFCEGLWAVMPVENLCWDAQPATTASSVEQAVIEYKGLLQAKKEGLAAFKASLEAKAAEYLPKFPYAGWKYLEGEDSDVEVGSGWGGDIITYYRYQKPDGERVKSPQMLTLDAQKWARGQALNELCK